MTANQPPEPQNAPETKTHDPVVGCTFPPNAHILGLRRRLYKWFPVKSGLSSSAYFNQASQR